VTGQTAIPVAEEPRTGPCAWCGETTSMQLVLEQSYTTAPNGTRVPKKTKAAWVCPAHNRTLQRREGAGA
jgi:hypothetical protein